MIPGFAGIGASWPPKSTQTGVVDGTPQVSAAAAREAPAPGASVAAPPQREGGPTSRPVRVASDPTASGPGARRDVRARDARRACGSRRAGAPARSRRGGARARGARPARRRRRGPRAGRGPTRTARAPSASAFRTSVPRRMPPSRSTSIRPSTASTTSGSASIVAATPSSWRPPWFETTIAAAPCSHASVRVLGGDDPLQHDRQPRERREPLDVAPT